MTSAACTYMSSRLLFANSVRTVERQLGPPLSEGGLRGDGCSKIRDHNRHWDCVMYQRRF